MRDSEGVVKSSRPPAPRAWARTRVKLNSSVNFSDEPDVLG